MTKFGTVKKSKSMMEGRVVYPPREGDCMFESAMRKMCSHSLKHSLGRNRFTASSLFFSTHPFVLIFFDRKWRDLSYEERVGWFPFKSWLFRPSNFLKLNNKDNYKSKRTTSRTRFFLQASLGTLPKNDSK